MDEIALIVVAAIERHAEAEPAALATAIIERLWEAGYEIRPRPDMIPILLNPGHA
jgi:predicted trehalose synthase